MANTTAVKGNKKLTSSTTEYNAQEFHVRNTILNTVNTAIPVIVTAVDAGGHGSATGYVTVKPLVCQVDGFGEALDPAELFKVPYSRIQGGAAALVIDPIVGDIGLAVFAKSDCSNVAQEQSEPVQPGSFRKFSMADGFYIGGFLNRPPEVYIECEQQSITINAMTTVTVNAPSGATVNSDSDVVINAGGNLNANISGDITATAGGNLNANISGSMAATASGSATISASRITLSAPSTSVTGNLSVGGSFTMTGSGGGSGATMIGGITNSGGSISSNGITLESHVHGGVESGGSTTSGPQ